MLRLLLKGNKQPLCGALRGVSGPLLSSLAPVLRHVGGRPSSVVCTSVGRAAIRSKRGPTPRSHPSLS